MQLYAKNHEVQLAQLGEELARIRRSGVFAEAKRSWNLLEYLCNKVLLGEGHEIKESTIAIDVFRRVPDFDDKRDSIVRVEAHRLRKRLQRYYEAEGPGGPVRIELAPGSYVPRLVEQAPEQADKNADPPSDVAAGRGDIPPPKANHRHKTWLGVAVLLAVLVMGGTFRLARGSKPAAVKEMAPKPALSAAPRESGLAAGSDIRILAGSQEEYTDRQGAQWGADRFFQGGGAVKGPREFFGKPVDAGLFKSMRIGKFSYAIPAPPGAYEMRLYFVEPQLRSSPEVAEGDGENDRFFNIELNGKPLLENFDIVADSGFAATDVRAFRDVRAGADGFVRLNFDGIRGEALVNAVELLPYVEGRIPDIRLRAAELSFTDRSNRTWSQDNFFIGGKLATHEHDVSATTTPDLYASERYGNFEYAIPVPPGRYAVHLYFAETWWGSEEAGRGGVGDRVFDVSCNGEMLLRDFDMIRTAGPFRAIEKTFHRLEPNGQGKLLLGFTPVHNYALVRAIEVQEER